ncbi:MAG: hypothetical protein V9H69_20930 [Anaerolineae bacterium]
MTSNTDKAQQPAAAARSLFDNRGMRVGGSVYQAAGNQYIGFGPCDRRRDGQRGQLLWPRPSARRAAAGAPVRGPALPGRQPAGYAASARRPGGAAGGSGAAPGAPRPPLPARGSSGPCGATSCWMRCCATGRPLSTSPATATRPGS